MSELAEVLENATRELVQEASKRRGASRAVPIKRLPDGTFAPKGMGQVLKPGTRVVTPDGKAGVVRANGDVTVSKGGMRPTKIKVKGVKFDSLDDAAKAGALPSQRNPSGAQQRADAAKTNASMTPAQKRANAAQAAGASMPKTGDKLPAGQVTDVNPNHPDGPRVEIDGGNNWMPLADAQKQAKTFDPSKYKNPEAQLLRVMGKMKDGETVKMPGNEKLRRIGNRFVLLSSAGDERLSAPTHGSAQLATPYFRKGKGKVQEAEMGDVETAVERVLEDAWGGKPGTNWKQVGPAAKKKLSPLVRHYMGKAHPFTSCVNDNTKRFGRERAERICAVVKDLGRRSTKWRKGGKDKVSEADESAFVDAAVREMVEAGLETERDVDLIAGWMEREMNVRVQEGVVVELDEPDELTRVIQESMR